MVSKACSPPHVRAPSPPFPASWLSPSSPARPSSPPQLCLGGTPWNPTTRASVRLSPVYPSTQPCPVPTAFALHSAAFACADRAFCTISRRPPPLLPCPCVAVSIEPRPRVRLCRSPRSAVSPQCSARACSTPLLALTPLHSSGRAGAPFFQGSCIAQTRVACLSDSPSPAPFRHARPQGCAPYYPSGQCTAVGACTYRSWRARGRRRGLAPIQPPFFHQRRPPLVPPPLPAHVLTVETPDAAACAQHPHFISSNLGIAGATLSAPLICCLSTDRPSQHPMSTPLPPLPSPASHAPNATHAAPPHAHTQAEIDCSASAVLHSPVLLSHDVFPACGLLSPQSAVALPSRTPPRSVPRRCTRSHRMPPERMPVNGSPILLPCLAFRFRVLPQHYRIVSCMRAARPPCPRAPHARPRAIARAARAARLQLPYMFLASSLKFKVTLSTCIVTVRVSTPRAPVIFVHPSPPPSHLSSAALLCNCRPALLHFRSM